MSAMTKHLPKTFNLQGLPEMIGCRRASLFASGEVRVAVEEGRGGGRETGSVVHSKILVAQLVPVE